MTIQQAIASPGCGCETADTPNSLMCIDEALSRIAAHVAPPERSEAVAIHAAAGRVLARPVRSRYMAPPFDNAAMDGYALATALLEGEGPWRLPVTARVPAGQAGGPLRGAGAARIFTGAPIPDGADVVVMQEEVVRDRGHISLYRRPDAGENIRRAGSDMAAGTVVAERGRRLGPRDIAACAAAGAATVHVRPRLRVALLVTGDELRQAGQARTSAQIWDVNTPMLAMTFAAAGADLVLSERGADSPQGLARQLADMARQCDLVVTTGGVSVGEEDHVKSALGRAGGEIRFSGVAIKPGKPVSFGRLGAAVWLGLPGNPVSALVTWHMFGAAAMRGLSGEAGNGPRRRHVVCAGPIRRKPGRCELRPARFAGFDPHGREVVVFENATHSGRVGGLARADGLIFLPADVEALPAGALIEFLPFSDTRGAET